MKNVGDTLKKLREENKMTRKEATDKLKVLGIDISDKTLYGYESGRNSANADMFLALCKIYNCNNIMETFSETVEDILFTNTEWKLVEKYRTLDSHGKEMVDIVLQKEWERSTLLKPAAISSLHIVEEPELNAAHERPEASVEDQEADNAMMDAEKF